MASIIYILIDQSICGSFMAKIPIVTDQCSIYG